MNSTNHDSVFSQRRFAFCMIAGVLFAGYVFLKYAQTVFTYTLPPPTSSAVMERGPILDRNGKVLALETIRYNLGLGRADVPNNNELMRLIRLIAPIIQTDENLLQNRIKNAKSNFIYLKKDMDKPMSEAVIDLARREKLPGLRIDPVISRTYPEHRLAAHVVGFMGVDGKGLTGLEAVYNDILTPEIPTDNSDAFGNHLYTTIDTNLQFALEKVAAETMEGTGAESMMMIAAEARTGEILAYISNPAPDLTTFPTATENEKKDRPAMFAYEPGSVFKIFSIAAAMDSGGISPNSAFICDGLYTFTSPKGETIRINCLGHHGTVHAREVLQYSCNDGTAQISETIASDVFETKLRQMGFGTRTKIELPGETAGMLSPHQKWSLRSQPTIAMGQEIAVSALQMVSAATMFANCGNKIKLTLISRITDHDGKLLYRHQPVIEDKVISAQTAEHILSCMRTTAEQGTGLRANVGDVSMAVKTGTAQMFDPKTRTYSTTDFISSCMALFPAENPEIILYTVIVKAKGETYGGRIAAPVIKKMANTVIDYLAMERNGAPSILHEGVITLPPRIIPEIGEAMPDLRGISKRTAAILLKRTDINVVIEGDGYVQSQFPPPGTQIEQGMTIELRLE